MDLFSADVLAYAALIGITVTFGVVTGLASRAADRRHRWTQRQPR